MDKLPTPINGFKRYELCLMWPTAEDALKFGILAYKWDNELLVVEDRFMYVQTKSFFIHMIFNYTNTVKPEIRRTGYEDEPCELTLADFETRERTRPPAF